MNRIAFAIVMLAASIAAADGHQRSIFRGELRVQVWSPDGKPLREVTVAFHVGNAADAERLTVTSTEEPPELELRAARKLDARSPRKTTANVDELVARYRSQAPFWRIGPGTYNIKIALTPPATTPVVWSDPIEVKFRAGEMRWEVIATLDQRANKLVGKPIVRLAAK
jgi:hypothetical protein